MRPVTAVFGGVLALSLVGSAHSLWSVLLAIFGIASLIFVHELGHFLACKMTKTRVETFSVGFGPRLFGWETPEGGKRRFTLGARRLLAADHAMDVRVAAIPLGGYVKMAGEIGGDGTATSGVAAARRAPLPDEFPAKSIAQRTFIASAGVIMNFLAAILLFCVSYAVGYDDHPPIVGDVRSGGPAWRAGLTAGDRVVSYDGTRIRTFMDLQQEVALTPRGDSASVEIERAGKPLVLRLTPEYDETAGIQQVHADLPQQLALVGDDGTRVTIDPLEPVRVDGRPVVGGRRAAVAIQDALDVGKKSVRVERAGGTISLSFDAPLGKEAKSGAYKLGVSSPVLLVVEAVRPGGAAAASGIEKGDEIVEADGEPVRRASELATRAAWRTAKVLRAGTTVEVPIGADDPVEVAAFLSDLALRASPPAGVVTVSPLGVDFADGKSPAGEAGVRHGDRLLEIDGKPVKTWSDVIEAGKAFSSKPVRLKVQTGTESPRELVATPRRPRDPASADDRVRLSPVQMKVPVSGLGDAASLGVRRAWFEVKTVFRVIARFVRGDVSFSKNVSGPLTIAQISSATASVGLGTFLAFLAFISVNLAVLNILPVPVLDGGTIVLLIAEKIKGRPLSDSTIGKLQLVGFGLLLLLMVFALKNDFVRLFGG